MQLWFFALRIAVLIFNFTVANFTYLFVEPFSSLYWRYKEGHAIRHWKETQHSYSLDLTKQQIWDYVGDNYVHRLNHSKADNKCAEMNYSQCLSLEGDCDSCTCSEDSGFSGALYSSKVDAVCNRHRNLLRTYLFTNYFFEFLSSIVRICR